VAYGLVATLIAGIVALQLTYQEPVPVAEATDESLAEVALNPPASTPAPEPAAPPIEDDTEVSDATTPEETMETDDTERETHGEEAHEAAAPPPTPPAATPQAPTAEEPAAQRTAVLASALPALPRKLVLAPAPEPAVLTDGRFGPLPRIAEDGREPWKVYARPFPVERDRPRIAILLQDLGLSQEQTNTAIQQLPGSVTLGFAPYARRLDQWIDLSRAAGHEVLLQVPMEPFDFPTSDPGPHTLLTSAGQDENLERLEFLLSRFTGYVGVYNRMGDRFTSSIDSMQPVLQSIHDRGLLFVDARTSGTSVAGRLASDLGLPHALNNREIDQVASRVEIDAKLIDLENIARQQGQALGIARPYPVTLERLAQWATTLEEKGIDLAPVSALTGARR
jgi:polysaccharide deacetylase 2 family uncharacterized protein YibQ